MSSIWGCNASRPCCTASEGPAYSGTHFSNDTYNRKFVCGYGPGEKLGEKEAVAESAVLAVVSLNDKPAYVRYAMVNLPTMPRLKQMLAGVPDDELARAVFTRVSQQLGPEWTAVFSAPNKDGDLAMYVAHAGAMVEFPPVKK